MRGRRLHILVAEPSLILRRGLIAVLFDIDTIQIDIAELDDLTLLKDEIVKLSPDVVIVSPYYLGMTTPKDLQPSDQHVRFVALQSSILQAERLKEYDATITILDTATQINEVLCTLASNEDRPPEDELSQREREIVAAIALGKTNKEIAGELFISQHTVMTHRKNIAAKLKIHNSAGLTIYAVVNKLIDVSDIP